MRNLPIDRVPMVNSGLPGEVSVIVPTLDSAWTIEVLLKSLIAQTHAPLEVIVVDGGSSDDTVRIAARAGAHVCTPRSNPIGSGVSAARNLGASEAQGGTLLFLDADMEAEPGLVAEVSRAASLGKRAIVVPETTYGRGLLGAVRAYERDAIARVPYLVAARGIDRDLFRSIDGFDEKLAGFEDLDIQAKLLENGIEVAWVRSAVRHHEEGVTLRAYRAKRRKYLNGAQRFASKHPEVAKEMFSPLNRLTSLARGISGPRTALLAFGAVVLRVPELLWRP